MLFNYSIRLLTDKSWLEPHLHFHDDYEILLSLSDAGQAFVENGLIPLKQGTLLLTQNGVLHRMNCNVETFERYVLHVPEEIFHYLEDDSASFRSILPNPYYYTMLNTTLYLQLKNLFNRLYHDSDSPENHLKNNITFLEILYHTISVMMNNSTPSDFFEAPSYLRIRPIMEYINQHIDEPLSLDAISEQFFFSKYYLCHLFKATTGFTIKEFINHSRLVRARALLREGFSVQEAGERAGFQNNSHFIRTFTSATGVSPGKYARNYRNSNKI